jgi:hypothetical protein
MTPATKGHPELLEVLRTYQVAFKAKVYGEENDDHDALMDVFSINPATKRENRQYWGRELGMCWQRLVTTACSAAVRDRYSPGLRIGGDELCDLCLDTDAIDTKYRIGSGDSGTLKKFKTYGDSLMKRGLRPVMLILRDDNLPAAVTACKTGGWTVFSGDASFEYLQGKVGVDLKKWLLHHRSRFGVVREG